MGVEKSKKYYDQNMYKHIAAESKYQILYDKTIEFLPPDKNIEILDVGCGVGGMINTLLKNGYLNFSGIDFSEYCVNYCKERFKINSFYEVDLKDQNAEITIKKFSTIISLEVLEHITDDVSVIKMLPKDCLFIFSLPDYDAKAHVRSFKSIDEIYNKFGKFLKFESTLEIPIGKQNKSKIFLIKSRRV